MTNPATVYLAYGAKDKLLYVGVTGVRTKRFSQHRAGSEWWAKAERIELEHFPTRSRALAREADLISTLKPPFNKAGLDRKRPSRAGLITVEDLGENSPWPAKWWLKKAESGELAVVDWDGDEPLIDEEDVHLWLKETDESPHAQARREEEQRVLA